MASSTLSTKIQTEINKLTLAQKRTLVGFSDALASAIEDYFGDVGTFLIDSDDTIADYFSEKIKAGENITFTETVDETTQEKTLTLNASGGSSVSIATTEVAGTIISTADSDTTKGAVSVDEDGKATVNGWNDLSSVAFTGSHGDLSNILGDGENHISDLELSYVSTMNQNVSTTSAVNFASVTATSLIKSGGTSLQFLKADGTVDSNSYLTTSVASLTYAPLSRILTINGSAQDLNANRSWSVGTVTSVGLSLPTGLSVTGSPVTTSGTLAVTFSSGYSIPTTSNQTNWSSAYTFTSGYATNYPDLVAIEALSGTAGFLKKTAANTWALDPTSYLSANQPITLSGDVTGSGQTSIAVTLATVNGNTGTFGNSTGIPYFTVNGKGLITAAGTYTGEIANSTTGNAATATKLANINTTFFGTYPLTVNVNGTIYSHTGITFNGTTGGLSATSFIGSLSGNASTATTLQTARTIGLSGVTSTAQSFNGSANITIPITAVPASLLTGTKTSSFISDFSNAAISACSGTYLTANQSITLSGGANGSGQTSITVTALAPEYLSSGYIKNAVYYGLHPEGQGGILSCLENDAGYLLSRGGTCSMYTTTSTDYTVNSLNVGTTYATTNTLFNGQYDYFGFSVSSTSTVVVIDFYVPSPSFTYTNNFYIDFGATAWKASSIALYKTTSSSETYTLISSTTSNTNPAWKVSFSNSYTAYQYYRVVLTGFSSTTPRIAQIGLKMHSGNGLSRTYVSRSAGAIYGTLYPYPTNTYSCGSSTYQWSAVYATNFYENGTALSSKYLTTAVTSLSATTPIVASASTGAVTLTHATSGVTASTYGSASTVPVFTVNTYGHVTGVTATTISITSSQVSDFSAASISACASTYVAKSGSSMSGELTNSAGIKAKAFGKYYTATPALNASGRYVIDVDASYNLLSLSSSTSKYLQLDASTADNKITVYAKGLSTGAYWNLYNNTGADIILVNAWTYNGTQIPVITNGNSAPIGVYNTRIDLEHDGTNWWLTLWPLSY